MRRTTVLHPQAKRDTFANQYKETDYISVPLISTYGTYRVIDMVTDVERASMARLANSLEY